jgi:hypothetical protein
MKNRKKITREFLEDFLSGGFLVVLALGLAYTLSPVLGGVVTGLPIRYAATWLLAARRRGAVYAEHMAKGSMRGMIGNILFSVTLFLVLIPLGFAGAFALALIVCIGTIVLLKTTFPG